MVHIERRTDCGVFAQSNGSELEPALFLIYITEKFPRQSEYPKDASNLHLTRPFVAI